MKLKLIVSVSLLVIINLTVMSGCSTPAVKPAETADSSGTKSIHKAEFPGVVNYSQTNAVYGINGSPVGFGGATESTALPLLKEKGYKTVINLRLASEEGVDIETSQNLAQQLGLNYIHLPYSPANLGPDDVSNILATIGDAENQPVYVHCGSATRVGAIWMIRRALVDGWEMDEAQKEAEAIAKKPEQAVSFATSYISANKDKTD